VARYFFKTFYAASLGLQTRLETFIIVIYINFHLCIYYYLNVSLLKMDFYRNKENIMNNV